MGKAGENFKKYFKTYLIYFIIFLVIGVGVFLGFFFGQNRTIVASLNGSGIAFAILAASGGLSWLARMGAFDTMSYGFKQMFGSMFGKEANKYNDMAAYKEDKNTKRTSSASVYFSIFAASVPFLIAFVVLEIVKHALY